MNKKQFIKETIEHWKRMINWAKKQKPKELVYWKDMEDKLSERWYSDDCSFCKEYIHAGCLKCPLHIKYGNCENPNSENFWSKVNESKTWGAWVKNAEKFMKQLESLK